MENKETNFQFKDFLYLNNYFLESYTAQKNNGFPKEIQRTRVDQKSNEEVGEKIDTEETLDEKTGVASGSKTDNSKTISSGKQFNQNNIETSQNVLVKVEKDNMYHKFIEYVEENDLFTDIANPDIGKYINLYESFYYIDFDRIQKLCNEDYLAIYQSNINSADFTDGKFYEIKNKVALLKELIPFEAILYNKNYIVLIDKLWLKTKKEYLGYLLGEKVNVVGKVTKSIQVDDDMPSIIKILNRIQEYTLTILHELGFGVSDKVFVISPIAIYH